MIDSEHPTEKFTKLGEECESGKPDNVWQCRIDEFIKAIDPSNYFLTSGEGIFKTEKLIADCREMLSDSLKFLKLLQDIKGQNEYLETEIMKGHVIFRAKNSRKKNKNAKNNKRK